MMPLVASVIMSARGRRVAPASSSLAAWNTGAVNEWKQISGTNLSSVEPSPVPAGSTGPSSKVVAWTGYSVDTTNGRVYLAACGGHGDYSGNEVDMLNLNANSPAWSELRGPTASVSNGNYYADGRPSAVHNYYMVDFDEVDKLVMLFGGSRYSDGAIKTVVDAYDVAAGDYDASGTYPNIPAALSGQEVKACCKDPATGDVYMAGNYSLVRWNRSAKTWTTLANGTLTGWAQYTASAVDTTRNRIFFVGNGVCWTWDIAGGSETARSLTGTDLTANTYMGMVYVPSIDKFIVSTGSANGTVYQIDPATFACSTLSTTGGSGMPSETKPLRRFLYVPSQQGIVWVPSYTGSVWFLRTH